MEEAKRAGALVMLDGAQAAGHGDVADFDRMPVDFYVASAHKMMGLGGAGTLVCSDGALERMAPVRGGGGMIERVDREGYVVARRPNAFEAGTPAIAATVAWSAALAMMEEAGLEAIRAHAGALAADAARRLAELPGVRLLGDRRFRENRSSPSWSTASIRTMRAGCSTTRGSWRGQATTAPSLFIGRSAFPPACARASLAIPPPRMWTRWSRRWLG